MAQFHHDDIHFHYEHFGQGHPVIFLPGVWMTSQFFQKQLAELAHSFQVFALDYRGHGQSSDSYTGHTIAMYAHDVHAFINTLDLQEVTLVGWSMGAQVMWNYFEQFGLHRIRNAIVIDEGASEFAWPDYALGQTTFEQLCQIMHMVQTDRDILFPLFIKEMFKEPLPLRELQWMQGEMTQIAPSSASAIFFDLIVQDYRNILSTFNVPTLLCFGRDEKMASVAAGEELLQLLPQAQMVIFEESGHCPFWEEPNKFNREIAHFIKSGFTNHPSI